MSPSIPEAKQPAVARALIEAFGTAVPDSVAVLGGGLSGAGIYRIRVGGIAYLLRIEGGRDVFRDPDRWYGCMRTAAEACLAPPVRYACEADGVAIMDFVTERSMALDYAGSRGAMLTELAQTIRILHQTPGFPPLMDYLDAMDMLIGQLRASGVLAPDVLDEPLARYTQVAAVYRRLPPDLVSSHNDLNPRNVIYDGRRLWLVDWESAFRSDRFVDVASLLNFFTADEGEAEVALRAYFGAAPDLATRARLFLARQINHVFYAVMFLGGAAAERPGERIAGEGLTGPTMAELHRALSIGEPVLDTWEGRAAYGKSRLAAALANLKGSDLAPALAALGA